MRYVKVPVIHTQYRCPICHKDTEVEGKKPWLCRVCNSPACPTCAEDFYCPKCKSTFPKIEDKIKKARLVVFTLAVLYVIFVILLNRTALITTDEATRTMISYLGSTFVTIVLLYFFKWGVVMIITKNARKKLLEHYPENYCKDPMQILIQDAKNSDKDVSRKLCPECKKLQKKGVEFCPDCGHKFTF